jgi:hypothetical protein
MVYDRKNLISDATAFQEVLEHCRGASFFTKITTEER